MATKGNNPPSEHLILERSIDMLEEDGLLGMIVPDGLLNNPSASSNCPAMRRFIVSNCQVPAIVSLPDHAFRHSGAQNKTSILFLRKFKQSERQRFRSAYEASKPRAKDDKIGESLKALNHRVFLAEADEIGYGPTGHRVPVNDLYAATTSDGLSDQQEGSILGEYRRYAQDPSAYDGCMSPDCLSIGAEELWSSHASHRLDPKYHLFKAHERSVKPSQWLPSAVRRVMSRRLERVRPETKPDDPVVVLTVSQDGSLSRREPAKGKAPPEWIGAYFASMSSKWYRVRTDDLVFSRIDLWKGCISIVPEEFDGALVTSEFPVYEVTDSRIDPEFLSEMLRTRYYMRAFRAITTGHSNRRRTQEGDFENLDIMFPDSIEEQRELVRTLRTSRADSRAAQVAFNKAISDLSDIIEGLGPAEYYTDLDE